MREGTSSLNLERVAGFHGEDGLAEAVALPREMELTYSNMVEGSWR